MEKEGTDKMVGAIGNSFGEHRSLVSIDTPVPTAGGWVVRSPVPPEAVDLPRGLDIRRCYHRRAVVGVVAAGSGIVSSNVESQSRKALRVQRRRVQAEKDVGEVIAVSESFCPPGETDTPSFPRPPIRCCINGPCLVRCGEGDKGTGDEQFGNHLGSG